MNRESVLEQRTVTSWFDAIYRRKGSRYLRPIEAYWIFPRLLEVRATDKLLDVACGLGHLLQAAACSTGNLYGIDISRVAVSSANRLLDGAQIIVGNAERLPYRDSTFDVITCLGSLERMLDMSLALSELRRVGTANARYCFLVRNSNTPSWRYFARLNARQRAESHAQAFDLPTWRQLFRAAGFEPTTILPDQYPLHMRRLWASLFLGRVDFTRTERTRRDIETANEFIFLLTKRE